MDDYISRHWLMECVNEGWIKFDTEKDKNKFIHLVRDIAPSAQPELIRCKDCKWYEGDIMANPWGVCCHDGWTSGNIGHEVSESGWCYRAERRTDAAD